VAWGRWVGSGVARSLAMLGCVAVVFGAGVVRPWVSGVGMQWSPVAALWALTEKPADFELGGLAAAVGTVAAAAVLGWAVLLGWGVFAGRARASGTGMLK